MFRFVIQHQAKPDIAANSFVIITNNSIHVFDEERRQIAKIHGM